MDNVSLYPFIYNLIAGSLIIGFGLVLLFISNKVKVNSNFNIAKNLLALYMILTGLSFYIAYAVGKFNGEKIEMLNFTSILFYFIITSLLLSSFIFLFDFNNFFSRNRLLKRALIPISGIIIYIMATYYYNEYRIYNIRELIINLPKSPILILRIIVFILEIDFFFYLTRKLTKIKIENQKIMKNICSANDYINKRNELYFIVGSLCLFVVMMLYYIFPNYIIDFIAAITLITVNLFFAIILINYQSTYTRLTDMVKFVESNVQSEQRYTSAKYIRERLNEWYNNKLESGIKKDITLHDIALSINIDSSKLYEFISYEYGINFEQWVIQNRIKFICTNINNYENLSLLSQDAGFDNEDIMKKVFYEHKYLTINEYKSLNINNYDILNSNVAFTIWIYDTEKNSIRILMGNKTAVESIPLDSVLSKLGKERSRIIHKIANDANIGIYERRHCKYTLEDLKSDTINNKELICVPISFIEGRSPMIVGFEIDQTHNQLIIKQLTELLSKINNDKSKAIESRDSRTSMLASITHDIRTPLNALIGFSQLLQSVEDDTEREEYCEIINSSAQSLLMLINDLLDFARIESGHINLSLTEFSINQLIREIHYSLSGKIIKGVDFKLNIPNEEKNIVFDRVRLSQIITNFSTNAIKFTKEGEIEMGYQVLDNKTIKIYVKDTGCGIDKNNHKKVFGKFERFNSAEPGTGLGLNICKAIANATCSEIGFESELNKGSTFWIKIT